MDGKITSLPAPASLSADVEIELQHLYQVLATPAAADRLWDLVLTPDEKTRLGRNVNGSAATLWKRLHGCSWARAIPVTWNRYPSRWMYFWTLCTASKAGAHVTARDSSQSKKPDNHVKAKSRLFGTKGFPRQLAKAIKAERGGKQKLTIDQEQIRIFKTESHDELVEVV